VGTGAAESLGATAASPNRNIAATVAGLPGELMYGIQVDEDINCRTVGRCTHGALLDREILDLVPREVVAGGSVEQQLAALEIPLSKDLGRRFLYARYNADLSRRGLDSLGSRSGGRPAKACGRSISARSSKRYVPGLRPVARPVAQ
jgi:hypothetical protein